MKIIVLPKNNNDNQVKDFLEYELTATECLEVLEKMEGYEKFTLLDLIKTEKMEKIEGKLYELRVKIPKLHLRFFGKLFREELVLVYVFKKKSNKIPNREIENARRKAELLDYN